ncbi:HEAT repeat domain-containing protein [Paenibacillus sp. PK4536]|uniref:HEAT repeat domain-containing protein n=1 Tax=Paenibacillus sp. PK4536 TaxID=3024576 RepID=UPI002359EB7E|nr:HEAT repeat domain-containing protein [Paenibacillus sp. PK4536]WIM41107.1 HEAT repeat domain-containing protein [Paenibacillus sp. PK4536]
MSTSLLEELYREVKYLYIAGSTLATSAPRLQHILHTLTERRQQSVVWQRLADQLSLLLDPRHTEEVSKHLQSLTLLLVSALRTQGQSKITVSIEPIHGATVHSSQQTYFPFLSYTLLAPVQKALTSKGGGRYEVIEKAYEAGFFQDIRLLPLAIGALHDSYSAIIDLAVEKLIPFYGATIVPYLWSSLDRYGGQSEAYKLQFIYQQSEQQELEQYYDLAQSGSDEVRQIAIQCLQGQPQYVNDLLTWTTHKRKGIRQSAYIALAYSEDTDVINKLYTDLSGKDAVLVYEALNQCTALPLAMQDRLAQDLKIYITQAIELQNNQLPIEILQPLRDRMTILDTHAHPVVEEAYIQVLEQPDYFSKIKGCRILYDVTHYFSQFPTKRALDILLQIDQGKYLDYVIPHTFVAAYHLLTSEQLYKQYIEKTGDQSKLIDQKPIRQKLIATIERMVITSKYEYAILSTQPLIFSQYKIKTSYCLPVHEVQSCWDKRWLDWSIRYNSIPLAATFANAHEPRLEKFLIQKCKEHPNVSEQTCGWLLQGLDRIGIEAEQKKELMLMMLEDERSRDCEVLSPYLSCSLLECCTIHDRERLQQIAHSTVEEIVQTFYPKTELVFTGKMISKYGKQAVEQLKYMIQQLQS